MKKGSDIRSCDEWEVVVVRNLEEIEGIRPTWEQMQGNEPHPAPDADIDRYLSVVKASGDDVRPCVVLMERNDRPAAMIISRVEKRQLKLRLGYKSLLSPTLKCLSVVYGGILGRPEGELCSLLVGELMKQLRSRKADVVYFNHLRTDTAFYRAVRKMPGFLTRGYFPRIDEHWCMSVPGKIDEFYSARSRNHRHNLRKAIRKFEKEYPGDGKFIDYTTKSDVDDFIQMAADISSKTYQGALGAGIVNDERTKGLLTAAATQGWFRGHVLLAGDKPCAFQLGLRYDKVYYMVSIGYDPALVSYKPGTILFLRVLESLCADPSTDTVDFYFGDAEYKKRYGTEHWPEACVYVFGPRLYLVFINVLRGCTVGVNAGLEYVVNRIGSVNWIKRRWRNLLQAKNPGSKYRVGR